MGPQSASGFCTECTPVWKEPQGHFICELFATDDAPMSKIQVNRGFSCRFCQQTKIWNKNMLTMIKSTCLLN